MRRIALITALALMPIGANAHDYDADLHCAVTENDGSHVLWSFAWNSADTLVETGYIGGGKAVISQAGQRPVWVVIRSGGTIDLIPRATPAWRLHEDQQGTLTLVHRSAIVGAGRCSWNQQPTSETVPDIAPE
jgi:hypothetical protein